MAISVNNHETRIKALESKGASSWTKGSNSNGYWAKESTTGLIIQWSRRPRGNWTGWRTITFPIAFTENTYYANKYIGTDNQDLWSSSHAVRNQTLTTCEFGADTAEIYGWGWIAIGYLISDRILNYIYKAFAIIFTLIFGIRLVSKFTV